VRQETSHETPIGFKDLEELANAREKQVEAAGISLRETAKWITSGVAVAAAGVIAGTSLSSLGALGPGWRLFAALSAVAVGLVGLGGLFAFAIKVIAPPSLTLQDFVDSGEISADWKNKIELRTKPLLGGLFGNTLKEFGDYLRSPRNRDGSPLSPDDTRSLKETRRLISLTANSELRRLLFDRLIRVTFVIAPIIALAIIAFAWAANPAKDELRVAPPPPLETIVDVNPGDIALLGKALGAPACAGAKLHVIVLEEWRSGIQDTVTVPKPSCPPVRLRLDQGRFSQMK
jgi:hypothetical protein